MDVYYPYSDRFMDFFQAIHVDGAIRFATRGKDTLAMGVDWRSQAAESLRMGMQGGQALFSVAAAGAPSQGALHITMAVDLEDRQPWVSFAAAPLLGLPGLDVGPEVGELMALLGWIKDRQIANPKIQLGLVADRVGDEARMEMWSDSKEDEDELRAEFESRVSGSPVLSHWCSAVLKGLTATAADCFDVMARLDPGCLMSKAEGDAFDAALPKPPRAKVKNYGRR